MGKMQEEDDHPNGLRLSRSPQLVAVRRRTLCMKAAAWSVLTFLTGLAGFLCASGFTSLCFPYGQGHGVGGVGGGGGAALSAVPGPAPAEAAAPCSRRAAPHRTIPLGGGLMDRSKYVLLLCQENSTLAAFFDEAKLVRLGGSMQSSAVVAHWNLAAWRKLGQLLDACWPEQTGACQYPPAKGPDYACPSAIPLKRAILLCHHADRPYHAWLRMGSVQLTTMETWVFLTGLTYWMP